MSVRQFDLFKVGCQGNCYVDYDSKVRKVVLHRTVVFREVDGHCFISSGGWKTKLTSTIINKCFKQLGSEWKLETIKGGWFLVRKNEKIPFWEGIGVEL